MLKVEGINQYYGGLATSCATSSFEAKLGEVTVVLGATASARPRCSRA